MDFKKVLNKRKSIRSFQNKKVPKDILKKVVEDAIKAPSSGNSQPWNFYIVTSKSKRDNLAKIFSQSLKLYNLPQE